MIAEKKQILTVKNIRNVNMDNILQSVIRNRSTTRSVLAKENGISLMTVKHVVDDLIAAGILTERESESVEVGRKPKVLELAECYGNIVCINLTSKDEASFLIYEICEELLCSKSVWLNGDISYQAELERVLALIGKELEQIPTKTVGAAVFVPSAYDESMDLVNYDLIAGFKELHIRALLEQKFGINNILVLHDVFAAARAEYDRLNPKPESQFYFYCGYGVGGFFIHQDEAVSGAERMAGEVGKMLVSMDGNNQDVTTLEDKVSISAVRKKMTEYGIEISFLELLKRYRDGEAQAVNILEPVLGTISRVLYNLLWIYNPDRVVIDSCKNEYSQIITAHFQSFMEKMRNDAIPIYAEVEQAGSDEYHMMRGCFHMTRNAWIEKISDSVL